MPSRSIDCRAVRGGVRLRRIHHEEADETAGMAADRRARPTPRRPGRSQSTRRARRDGDRAPRPSDPRAPPPCPAAPSRASPAPASPPSAAKNGVEKKWQWTSLIIGRHRSIQLVNGSHSVASTLPRSLAPRLDRRLGSADAHRSRRSCSCAFRSFPSPAAAQATGAITGIATDASGGVLPGVTIDITSRDTSQVRTAVTGADGFYTIPLVNPGVYQVKATLAGFPHDHPRQHHRRRQRIGPRRCRDAGRAARGTGDRARPVAAGRNDQRDARRRHRPAEGRRPAAERPQLRAARHADSRRRRAAALGAAAARTATPRPAASGT